MPSLRVSNIFLLDTAHRLYPHLLLPFQLRWRTGWGEEEKEEEKEEEEEEEKVKEEEEEEMEGEIKMKKSLRNAFRFPEENA